MTPAEPAGRPGPAGGAGPAGDLWPVLDGGLRSAASAIGPAAVRQVFDGIPGSKLPWLPVRPFFMGMRHYGEFAQVTSRLARLVLEACQRRAATAGELLGPLEMDQADLPLLDRAAPLSDDLLISVRPDAVYRDGVPMFLELNIEGSVGGTPHTDLIGPRFLRAYGQAGASLRAASSVDARFAALSQWPAAKPGSRIVIPVFPVGALPGLGDDPGKFMAWLAPWCEAGRRHGFDTIAFPLENLRLAGDGTLWAGSVPADVVLRLFLHAHQPASQGATALAEAVRAGTVAMHTPEATWLLTNKRTLAWLWSDLGELPEPDRRLVIRHVPRTAYLPAGTKAGDPQFLDARDGRTSLVLKPAHGYSGTGVAIGPTLTQQAWEAALTQAAEQGGYVLQEYVEPDTTRMEFVHRVTGDTRVADVPFVTGPFMFGGQPSGVLVRHGGPGGGPVLNAQQGAVVNTALLVDQPC